MDADKMEIRSVDEEIVQRAVMSSSVGRGSREITGLTVRTEGYPDPAPAQELEMKRHGEMIPVSKLGGR